MGSVGEDEEVSDNGCSYGGLKLLIRDDFNF